MFQHRAAQISQLTVGEYDWHAQSRDLNSI